MIEFVVFLIMVSFFMSFFEIVFPSMKMGGFVKSFISIIVLFLLISKLKLVSGL